MKSNVFNLCSTCFHKKICVLTMQKDQVWSCSEYDEISTIKESLEPPIVVCKEEPELMMV